MVFPESPNILLSINSSTASFACSKSSHKKTPLPSANPSAFKAIGNVAVSRYAFACFASVNVSYAAVGILYFSSSP